MTPQPPEPAAAADPDGEGGLPPLPEALRLAAGNAAGQLEAYGRLLATDGLVRGLLGPREAPRVWDRHVAGALALVPLLPQGARLVDVGSGAGLPGLPLGLVRPDLEVVLLEPLARRVAFLSDTLAALGPANVRVVRGRAEEQPDPLGDVVTARAVAPLARLLPWVVAVAEPGALLVLPKGEKVEEELALARSEGALRGLEDLRVERLTDPLGGEVAVVLAVVGETATPVRRTRAGRPAGGRAQAGPPRGPRR